MITASDLEFVEVDVPPVLAVQLQGRSAPDPGSISGAMAAGFGTVMAYVGRHHLTPNGPPRAIYTSYGAEGVTFLLAIPVPAGPGDAADPSAAVGPLPGARAYRFTHHGPYQNLMSTYGRITAFLQAKGWMQTQADWARYMPMWEEYRNDPQTTPPPELLTYIYLPAA